jgi:uncharacterized membrane protein YbhN (UPF0104 family)
MQIRTKHIVQILISLAITGVLLYAVFSDQSISSFAETISRVDIPLLSGYLLLSLFGVFCRAERYRVILRDTAQLATYPTRVSMLIVTLIRNGFVDLLPARLGETSFLYVCSRYGIPLLSSLSAFGVCLVLDILILFALLLLFLFFQLSFSIDSLAFAGSTNTVVILTGVTALLTVLLARLDWLIGFAVRIARLITGRISSGRTRTLIEKPLEWAQTVQVELAEVKKNGTYPRLALLTVGLRAAKYLSLYLLLLAVVKQFGVTPGQISPLLSTTAFIAAEASASLPVSGLMGFGAYEAAWSAIFSVSSVEIPSIPAVILAVHIITQVVGYTFAILAALGFFFEEFRSRKGETASNIEIAVQEPALEEDCATRKKAR